MEIIFKTTLLSKKSALTFIMRSFIFLLCTAVFGLSPRDLLSQDTKIVVDADKTVSTEEIFDMIDRQTDYSFVYNPSLFKSLPAVYLKKGSITVNKLLQKNLYASNFNITINKNNTIFIKEKILKKLLVQQKEIKGNITDENGDPLPGASVIEKGTTNGTQSDFDGNFSIGVNDGNAVLVVSYIGFLTKEIAVGEQTTIAVVLMEDAASLDEVVVVGYGEQSRKKVTNAVASIKSTDLVSAPIASFDEGLAGQLPGVQIVQTSGFPGGSSDINIRGIGTLTAGTKPLIVIDGFPYENFNLSSIHPNDIESVDVLKDAASAAIYGSRGSNGVLLVTTKKGKQGDIKFSYSGFTGFQEVAKTVDVQDAYERARFTAQVRINQGQSPSPLFQPYIDGTPGLTNTNWQDEIFRSASIQSHNISISGATEKMNFFVSTSYFDQEGIVVGSNYDRFNFRANLNFDISEKFRAGFIIAPSFSNQNRVSEQDHKGNGIILTVLIANPLFSAYNNDGSLNLSGDMILGARANGGLAQTENPVAMALLNENKRNEFDILAGGFFEFEPIEDLAFKTYLGASYTSTNENVFSPNTVGAYKVFVDDKQATASNGSAERRNWVIENTLSYGKTFNHNHNLNVLLGQTFQTENTSTTLPNPLLSQTTNINGILTTINPLFEEKWSLISYLGRVNYDFKDKYILSASIRRDGSSRFGTNTKWGWFPSVSGAWRLSQEDFFNSEIFSELKLRGSWGVAGNNSIPNYGSIPLLGSANYVGNTGVAPSTSPNENLSWEQTNTLDIGLDFGLFNNKLSFTVDYYKAITNDLLLNVPVPAHSGNTSSLRNIGKVQNYGFEFAIRVSNIKLGEVKWSSTFNISTNKNKVLELGPGQGRILTSLHTTEVGKPLGSYYIYRLLGLFETQEQIDNAPTHPEQELGDYRYDDLDGDGEITANDREIGGDFFPDYTFGFSNSFNYKNFDFNFLLQGKQAYEIYNGTGFFIRNLQGWGNGHADINNYYTTSNPRATFAHPGKHVKTYERSKLLIEDGSYIRLRSISLGYTMPESIIDNIFIDKLKIYISAKNLFTITDYTGFNPEVSRNRSNTGAIQPGVDYGAYPVDKSIVLGLNLSF